MTDLREVIILRTRQSHINMEEYRRGHNGPDSKCVGQCGSYVAENLDFMRFLLPLEFE